jgi:hypothetical protein
MVETGTLWPTTTPAPVLVLVLDGPALSLLRRR